MITTDSCCVRVRKWFERFFPGNNRYIHRATNECPSRVDGVTVFRRSSEARTRGELRLCVSKCLRACCELVAFKRREPNAETERLHRGSQVHFIGGLCSVRWNWFLLIWGRYVVEVFYGLDLFIQMRWVKVRCYSKFVEIRSYVV